ncbi:MAG: MmcQ/YjbR family DNA-binding protein [Salinivirgaceae bacterium]|jgi:predicted DNA-binding protein (MmcQ/YjbR family)|nr:MmcQ/YjbR family DNA-binding protein [Bacteroidales bacterium]
MIINELNVETIREYCIQKPFTTEEFPFDDVTLIFKVGGKMFAMIPLDEPRLVISLKCSPERSVELREKYDSIQPAYHMNKRHWNMIFIDGSVPKKLIVELIDHSYDLVFNKLPRKKQSELKNDQLL